MRRSALLLVMVVLLALPAGAFEDLAAGIRVTDPAGWEARIGSEKGALVRYYAPPGPGPRATLGLSVEELGEVESLTNAQVQGVVRRLGAELQGFQVLGIRKEEVAGLPGYRLGYRAKALGLAFRATQVMFVRGGRLYVVTLTSSDEAHAAHGAILDGFLKGIEFPGTP